MGVLPPPLLLPTGLPLPHWDVKTTAQCPLVSSHPCSLQYAPRPFCPPLLAATCAEVLPLPTPSRVCRQAKAPGGGGAADPDQKAAAVSGTHKNQAGPPAAAP